MLGTPCMLGTPVARELTPPPILNLPTTRTTVDTLSTTCCCWQGRRQGRALPASSQTFPLQSAKTKTRRRSCWSKQAGASKLERRCGQPVGGTLHIAHCTLHIAHFTARSGCFCCFCFLQPFRGRISCGWLTGGVAHDPSQIYLGFGADLTPHTLSPY